MNLTIDLADPERDVLTRLLERAVAELRVEVRRTRNPEFHDKLVVEEQVVKGMLAKVRS